MLIGGLPGTGKSTLARALAERGDFRVIRSDLVRKELAGAADNGRSPSAFGQGVYAAEWTERTYVECLRRAEGLLFEGKRVLVDANFRQEAQRRAFLEAASRWGRRASSSSARQDRTWCESASKVVGTTHRMPTGPFISRPQRVGRSRAP